MFKIDIHLQNTHCSIKKHTLYNICLPKSTLHTNGSTFFDKLKTLPFQIGMYKSTQKSMTHIHC